MEVRSVASMLPVAQDATDLGFSYGRLASRLQYAQDEIENLGLEIGSFGEILLRLHDELKTEDLTSSSMENTLNKCRIIHFSEKILDEMKRLKHKVKVIKRSPLAKMRYQVFRYIAKRRVNRLLKTDKMSLLYSHMESVKSSIFIFIQILLLARLRDSKNGGPSRQEERPEHTDRIKLLELQLLRSCDHVRLLENKIADLKRKSGSGLQSLTELSESGNYLTGPLLALATSYLPSEEEIERVHHGNHRRDTPRRTRHEGVIDPLAQVREQDVSPRTYTPLYPHPSRRQPSSRETPSPRDLSPPFIPESLQSPQAQHPQRRPASSVSSERTEYTGDRRRSAPYGPLQPPRSPRPAGSVPMPPFSAHGSDAGGPVGLESESGPDN